MLYQCINMLKCINMPECIKMLYQRVELEEKISGDLNLCYRRIFLIGLMAGLLCIQDNYFAENNPQVVP